MFYIHQINEITTVTFEKTVFQRKLIFKEMKGIDGFYRISGTQVKMDFFILCLGIFDFMKINFLISQSCFKDQMFWIDCKSLNTFIQRFF